MVRLGNRTVGDGHPTFVTYEAGPTHDGLDSAKKLVRLAAEAGADAIKFQIFDPDRLVADRKQLFSYEVLVDRESGKTEKVEEPLYDILCRRALTKDEWREVKRESDAAGIAFFGTIGFPDEVELLVELGCDSIKIASGDVNHLPLIRLAARTGMCLQLDTGNSTLGEIESAIDVARAEGNESIIIHQCPSGYPARLDSINLRIIPTLKQMFGYPVAYSDHTPGWEMDIAAVAMGANLVEKTITFDRTTPSVEHIFSLEPAEMSEFVGKIRDLERAMGISRRIMAPAELTSRLGVRRSVFLKNQAQAGQTLSELEVEYRRPGDGIPPDQYETFLHAKIRRDLPAGHKLSLGDLEA